MQRESEVIAMKTVILTIVLVLISVLLLGVKVLFVKGGRFPSGHAHDIPALRGKDIGCSHGGSRDSLANGSKTLQ